MTAAWDFNCLINAVTGHSWFLGSGHFWVQTWCDCRKSFGKSFSIWITILFTSGNTSGSFECGLVMESGCDWKESRESLLYAFGQASAFLMVPKRVECWQM